MDNIKNDSKYLGIVLEDRYELLDPLGSGGMAVVYRALDKRLNRNVAVKIMRPELAHNEKFRQRFQTESHAIAKLNHPNIVGVFDVSHSESIEYIVMELLDGITLKQYLRDNGPLDVRKTLEFSTQIASALSHAHEKGIVIGKDLSIVGYDDQILADYLMPGLTTMALPLHPLGDVAAKLLISKLENIECDVKLKDNICKIPCTFRERGSVADISKK